MTFKGGASYVPQVARNLQSYPVIPPGAFPNGLGAATPYTAEVSSAAFASAEAQAQKNYAETEAARQAAKQKEEEEFLAWCRSEGGCGAETGSSAPTEGGAEEVGEVEFTVDPSGDDEGEVISCKANIQNPHHSSHKPGTVNVVATVKCTAPIFYISIHIALYYDSERVAEGSAEEGGEVEFLKANAATKCKSGTYQGFAWGLITFPPGFTPTGYKLKGAFGASVKIKC